MAIATRKPISIRLDDEAAKALRLLESTGLSRSEAIRQALIEAATERTTRSALRREARRLANDPEDRAEKEAISALLDEISEPW